MGLKEIVQVASAMQPTNSTDITISISWFTGEKVREVQEIINRTDNNQKLLFIKGLLKTISSTHRNCEEKTREAAKKELAELFGEEILVHPVIVSSSNWFCFSLTNDGRQFRGWYGPFSSVSHNHFDSCGDGIVFHVGCKDPYMLRRWLEQVVDKRMIEWRSGAGVIWMGILSAM